MKFFKKKETDLENKDNPVYVRNLFFLLFIFLLGVWIAPWFKGVTTFSFADTSVASSKNPLIKSSNIKAALDVQNALREIYKEVNPSIVRIETEKSIEVLNSPLLNDPFFRHFFGDRLPRGNNNSRKAQKKQQGLGSGFILDNKGYVVTNYHVVAPNNKEVDKINVKLVGGTTHEAKLIGFDPYSDIALLKIEADNLKSSYIGDSDTVEVGDIAIAIGNPFGLSATFTMGVISSKGQDIKTEDGVERIQTDAAINPGNSGGPLLNIKGEVIGINQMIYTRSGGSIGIGFAIPINYAMSIIERLKKGEKIKRGYIGVRIDLSISEDNLKEQLKKLGIKKETGILLSDVELGSPAWKAGLRAYDIITYIDGVAVLGDSHSERFSKLRLAVIRKGLGSKLNFKILRDNKQRDITVVIGEVPKQ